MQLLTLCVVWDTCSLLATCRYDLAANYIAAHHEAEKLLTELVDPATSATICAESRKLLSRAQRVLNDLNQNFGDITRAIKTRHVVYALLKDTGNVAKELFRHGRC